MRIIISPAKKMNVDTDSMEWKELPHFMEDTKVVMEWVQKLSREEARTLWACNEKLAELNYGRFREMNLRRNLTPALVSYEGIQYQYMAPIAFSQKAWDYVQKNLRILSGFYGVVKPLDGVTPYRLEMQAKASIGGKKDLYDFWGSRLYENILDESRVIVNLASREYSKCIEPYVTPEDRFVTCVFGEWKNGKVLQKATQAKMARGEMVRFMAERGVECVEEIKEFKEQKFRFEAELSSENEYVFIVK